MLESKNHQQTLVSSGVLDLTFASRMLGNRMANVKSTPLATLFPIFPPRTTWKCRMGRFVAAQSGLELWLVLRIAFAMRNFEAKAATDQPVDT
jgi:hypothetical protein